MVTTTHNSLTILTAVTGNMSAIKADRFGLGLVAQEPPADFLSQGQFSLPRLSVPDQSGDRKDKGEPDTRYPESSGRPAGSVGSSSGATVCRSVSAVRTADPANPNLSTKASAKRGAKELWLTGDTAPAADLESKLNPFRRSRDCQSPRRQAGHQRDIPANHANSWFVRWPQVAAPAATTAK